MVQLNISIRERMFELLYDISDALQYRTELILNEPVQRDV